jgi:hypothetical protein
MHMMVCVTPYVKPKCRENWLKAVIKKHTLNYYRQRRNLIKLLNLQATNPKKKY